MSNSEKILKTISNLIENSILTSKDIRKELSTDLKFKKFFRARLAREIKKKTKLKVGITGMTDDFILAEKYIKKGYFDNVFIGRPFLKNPFFLYNQKILRRKGLKILPTQYARAF